MNKPSSSTRNLPNAERIARINALKARKSTLETLDRALTKGEQGELTAAKAEISRLYREGKAQNTVKGRAIK